jgi:hypothetical protein
MSLALQYGAPLENVGDLLAGAKFEPCGFGTFGLLAPGIPWSSCLLRERNGRMPFSRIPKARKLKTKKSSSTDLVKMM